MIRRRPELLPHGNLGFSRSSERTTSDAIRAEGERETQTPLPLFMQPNCLLVGSKCHEIAKLLQNVLVDSSLPLGNLNIQNSYRYTNMNIMILNEN